MKYIIHYDSDSDYDVQIKPNFESSVTYRFNTDKFWRIRDFLCRNNIYTTIDFFSGILISDMSDNDLTLFKLTYPEIFCEIST